MEYKQNNGIDRIEWRQAHDFWLQYWGYLAVGEAVRVGRKRWTISNIRTVGEGHGHFGGGGDKMTLWIKVINGKKHKH